MVRNHYLVEWITHDSAFQRSEQEIKTMKCRLLINTGSAGDHNLAESKQSIIQHQLSGEPGRRGTEAQLLKCFTVLCNALKTLLLIVAIVIGQFSYGQNENRAVESNYGLSLKKGDSIDLKTTAIFHFQNSEVAAFPASYAFKVFGSSDQYKDVTFITPDSSLIRAALTTLNEQYCNALSKFNRRNMQQTIDIHKKDGLREDLRKIRKQQKEQVKRHNHFCPEQQKQLQVKDKQIIAYRHASGDTILFIQTIDFRHDPYKLKTFLSTTWIDGWHGWFETNTESFHYHSGGKLLTINEDL